MRRFFKKMSRLIVFFMIIGCGKNRHSYLQWPATLGGLEGFSESQRKAVLAALVEINLKSQHTLIEAPELNTQSTSNSGSPIFFRFTADIPEQTKVIAGRATVDGDKCDVQISSAVIDNNTLLVPVLWHELGHCAGLDHNSNKGEIMYATTYSMKTYDEASLSRFFAAVLESSGLNAPK